MKRPSEKALRMLNEFYSSQSFWNSVVGRVPPIDFLDDVAASGEQLAIPELAPMLIHSAEAVREASARCIWQLYKQISPAELPHFEEACRNGWADTTGVMEAWRVLNLSAQHSQDDLLDMEDVLGKRIISTRLLHNATIREENAIAALEVMSRFAANPKWLIYLSPTMSPTATSTEAGLLEHPAEAFAYYRHEGIPNVICEEKHMGSRAVVVVCRDEEAARKRFGVVDEGIGIIYTRTGRRFFEDRFLETQFLAQINTALGVANFWEEFGTDWFCLDCELMPWSAKAQELLKQQYAAVGASASMSMPDAVTRLEASNARGIYVAALLAKTRERQTMVADYVEAYRRYCWPVQTMEGYKLAPFHVLASEGKVHTGRTNHWHMTTLSRLCSGNMTLFLDTACKLVDVTNPSSEAAAIEWWKDLTGGGGEGMVVKPLDFIAKGQRGLIQPAVECRGREYLRIIYGPEYTAPENLDRLRSRGLGAKRSLALREFALGIEALERFVRQEPLRRVHECVFGVLALESEPVDPRL